MRASREAATGPRYRVSSRVPLSRLFTLRLTNRRVWSHRNRRLEGGSAVILSKHAYGSRQFFKMADSDGDTFASFGTPFEILEEDAPRKKAVPIHEQIVTDTEGRRRFHGAFTGGFSAGYFNTVGTKEGWQPSTFVSSRSKKMEQRAQRPEDFMDEEDIGEFGIAPKRITTKEKFSVSDRESQSRKRVVEEDDALGVIPGEPVLQDLVLPVKMSVGIELLKKMGWKEGQGIGPRERRSKKKVIIMLR